MSPERRIPRLIHLNSPSGVGKSTIARLYADRHPGVLDLDIDRIVELIGGWQDDIWATFGVARNLAIGMIETHLRAGHDVVLPQLVNRADQIIRFEAAARRGGGEYREIVLTAGKRTALDRFWNRSRNGSGAERRLNEVIERAGGRSLIERIHDQAAAFLGERPGSTVIDTDRLTPEQAYDAVAAALDVGDWP